MQNLLTALTSDKGPAAAEAAFDQYSANWGSKVDKATIKKTIVDIETDYLFLVPTQTALYLHAKNAKCVNFSNYQNDITLCTQLQCVSIKSKPIIAV